MPTVSKEIALMLVKCNGQFMDDPPVIRIIEYTDMGGKQAYGLEYGRGVYSPSPYIINPKVFWEMPVDWPSSEAKRNNRGQIGIFNYVVNMETGFVGTIEASDDASAIKEAEAYYGGNCVSHRRENFLYWQ